MKPLTLVTSLSVGIMTVALSVPASAKSRLPLWDHGFETVSAVTPSTVVIKHSDGLEQQVGLSQVQVRASVYPAPKDILKVGETVSLWQTNQASPLLVVHPAATGTLVQSGSLWQVATKHRGLVTLHGSHPLLLGLARLTPGERVLTFGPQSPQGVNVTAVAARPLMVRTVVDAKTPHDTHINCRPLRNPDVQSRHAAAVAHSRTEPA